MNPYTIAVVAAVACRYLLDVLADRLNLRHLSTELPGEFQGVYEPARYRRSQEYLRETTMLGVVADGVETAAVLVLMLGGGFNAVDRIARGFEMGPVATGLVFAAILLAGGRILSLPFSMYGTFVIEAKYGFNRTTLRTYFLDIAKAAVLSALIGGPLLASVLWLFERFGPDAWVFCWGAAAAVQIALAYAAPVILLPLFNTFTPLAEGELRRAIEDCARSQDFAVRGIFTMDGSRRSAKANAFFTGFGGGRRIVLFDTLVEQHPVSELVAILAHEIGHCKKRHVLKAMVRMVLATGLTLFLLSCVIGSEGLSAAFRMDRHSVYASLLFFGFLYTPAAMVLGAAENALSRRNEYEADAFAATTCGDPDSLCSALKRLSIGAMSNLSPHPLKVVLRYSHPPVLRRIAAIRRLEAAAG